MANVLIAGAGGFVGRFLAIALSSHHHIIGLSRSPHKVDSSTGVHEWRQADLFSLLETEKALSGIDYAYYLVHSMLPSARLTQGRFEDIDLIAADNFARAAKQNGVKQILYLGGLIPKETHLSRHLASRLEVENTLRAQGVPVTSLRAGLILGTEGSSFQMMLKLVERLPVMICPRWTSSLTQPIDIRSVVEYLSFCLGNEKTYSQTFDIGGPEVLTYLEMMKRTARVLKKHTILIPVPLFTPGLSRLWVSLVTGASKNLVKPLVQSLRHTMVCQNNSIKLLRPVPEYSFEQSLSHALATQRPSQKYRPKVQRPSTVRSVQRLFLVRPIDAESLSELYFKWLPRKFRGLVHVQTVGNQKQIFVRPFSRPALVLEKSANRSSASRILFYITGGYLRHTEDRGRFEFRLCWDNHFGLVAIHEFRPRLIWPFYAATQARIHLWVMRAFARYLRRLS